MALKLKGSTSGFTAIDAPAVAGDNTLVLPGGNGTSGQYLQTNGSGVLSWAGVTTGKILQVVQTVKRDVTSTTATSYEDIPGMSRTITPVAADSNILVQAMVTLGADGTYAANSYVQLLRGSTAIFSGTETGRTQTTISMMAYGTGSGADFHYSTLSQPITFLDDPTYTLGDELTYKLQWADTSSSATLYLNRSAAADASSRPSAVSSIILMEVAA